MANPRFFAGNGNPNGSAFGNPGDLYADVSGTALYFKTSGVNTSAGWVALATAGGSSNPTPGFFGFADLGDATINAGGTVNSTTLAPGIQASLFYRNLHITNNTKVVLDPGFSNTCLFVDGTLTIDAGSSLDVSGTNGGTPSPGNGGQGGSNSQGSNAGTLDGGSGGPGPNPGSNATPFNTGWAVDPKKGGNGGNAPGGNNGGNGAGPIGDLAPFQPQHLIIRPLSAGLFTSNIIDGFTLTGDGGGGGGGGGSDAATATGGGGGGGGGILVVFARHVSLANGTMRALGGNGENASGGAGNAGGGGGGMGGVLILHTMDTGVSSAVANVAGGTGGAGHGTGAAGAGGSNGEIIIVDPTGTNWVHA